VQWQREGLDDYILRHVGRVPQSSMEIYRRVVDDFGEVHERSYYRALARLRNAGKIVLSTARAPEAGRQLFYVSPSR